MQTDGQRDRQMDMTQVTGACSDYANKQKNMQISIHCTCLEQQNASGFLENKITKSKPTTIQNNMLG